MQLYVNLRSVTSKKGTTKHVDAMLNVCLSLVELDILCMSSMCPTKSDNYHMNR